MTPTWRIERSPPYAVGSQSDESGSATSSPCSRYVLEYELDHGLVDHRPEHEAWLFEWCTACTEVDGVDAIEIDRRTDDCTTAISLRIDTQFERCRPVPDEFRTFLERLEYRVDDLEIVCRPASTCDSFSNESSL